jgi:2-polyprenyl-3-methyl-5-hydroxy-6-metoxy-1,4-benzoquinol methylase
VDFFETNRDDAALFNLLRSRSRQAVRLLDRYLFVMPSCPEAESALFVGFFEHIAPEYEDLIDPSCNLHNIHELISMLTNYIGDLHGLNVLDFGCGTGLSLGPVTAAGANLIGIDQAIGMRRIAEARGVRSISIEELQVWPGHFDGAIASYVFHLYPDDRSIEVLCSKLRSGGAVVGNFTKK